MLNPIDILEARPTLEAQIAGLFSAMVAVLVFMRVGEVLFTRLFSQVGRIRKSKEMALHDVLARIVPDLGDRGGDFIAFAGPGQEAFVRTCVDPVSELHAQGSSHTLVHSGACTALCAGMCAALCRDVRRGEGLEGGARRGGGRHVRRRMRRHLCGCYALCVQPTWQERKAKEIAQAQYNKTDEKGSATLLQV